jgi:transcriptional regulator with GAF, ATPase, and Fis domain
MKISKNRFFREATLRICGSLDVATFLHEAFVYIREAIDLPAEFVSIVNLSADKRTLFLRAVASDQGGLVFNDSVSVPASRRALVDSPESVPEVMIIDRLDQHPLACLWIDRGYENNTAQISIRLDLRGHTIGAVNFCTLGKNHFSRQHAEWLQILKEPFAVAISNAIRHQQLMELQARLEEDKQFLQEELCQGTPGEIVGATVGLKSVMGLVHQVARLDSPVLLLGETGTGKELIAGALHRLSHRRAGPFIKVNCGAILESLVDSELFGHERGAFTGAVARQRGRFERADKGTLFLDEVGELKPDAQVRLLRVLQEKEIERVGGDTPVPVDVRIIAATHRDLSELVRDRQFREDLFFRLNVFPIHIPPLRLRKEDIPALAHHFVQKKCLEMGLGKWPALTLEAYHQMVAYDWPGNVRELENAIERAIILSNGEALDLTPPLGTTAPPMAAAPPAPELAPAQLSNEQTLTIDALLAVHIRSALQVTNGKVHGENGAASLLGVNPSTLRHKMRRLGIPFGRAFKRGAPPELG